MPSGGASRFGIAVFIARSQGSFAVTRLRAATLLLFAVFGFSSAARAAPASLRVEGERFVLTMPDERRLGSAELVGAELTTQDGETFRIDAVEPSRERSDVLLHHFSHFDATTRTWRPACDADAYGRQAGFPVAGRWDARGRYVRDPKAWFLTCTSGSQGKCVLWGYDPWRRGPRGEDLADYYRACQYTVRANYDGKGEAHTKNGTSVDVFDAIGIEASDSGTDPAYAFEAGWGPRGAVCVARTRWPDLLTREALLKAAPHLQGRCDEATAHGRGALIFTRVMVDPTVTPPAETAMPR